MFVSTETVATFSVFVMKELLALYVCSHISCHHNVRFGSNSRLQTITTSAAAMMRFLLPVRDCVKMICEPFQIKKTTFL